MADGFLNNAAMEWRIFSQLQRSNATSAPIYDGLEV